MADTDHVVYPDEVEDVKAKATEAAGASGAGETNSVETPQDTSTAPEVAMRSLIDAPYNCPEGYEMDEKGVCREVF